MKIKLRKFLKIGWLGVMVLLLGVGTAFALDINVLILKDLKEDGKYLKLNHSGMLYDAGIKQLAESKLLEKVETLDLNTHNIGDEGAEALAKSKNLQNLKVLNLFNNQIENDGVKALFESKAYPKLSTISLFGNKIGPKGAEAIAESKTI